MPLREDAISPFAEGVNPDVIGGLIARLNLWEEVSPLFRDKLIPSLVALKGMIEASLNPEKAKEIYNRATGKQDGFVPWPDYFRVNEYVEVIARIVVEENLKKSAISV